MTKPTIIFILLIISLLSLTQTAQAATEFVCTIKESGGDYTSLGGANQWEDAVECDLTTAFTAGWDNQEIGDIADGAAVTWGVDGVGTLLHMTTVAKSGSNTFLLTKTSGTDPADNDTVTDGTNSFDINGTPDSVIAVAKIDGSWSSAETIAILYISGWTTSATNYIKIYTTSAARHDGKWNTNKYRLNGIFNIREDFIWLDGLQIDSGSGNAIGFNGTSLTTGAEFKLSNSIIKGDNSTTAQYGISWGNTPAMTNKIWNCIFYNYETSSSGTRVIYNNDSDTTVYLYNVTVSGGYHAFMGNWSNTVLCKNCISIGAVNGFANTFHTDCTNNASDVNDTDAPGSNKVLIHLQSEGAAVTDWFVSNSNFHINNNASYASEITDQGTDLSTDPDGYLSFTDDITGQTRIGIWDIGADELMVVGVIIKGNVTIGAY